MADKLCVIESCDMKLVSKTLLSSENETPIHDHLICPAGHNPYYCVTQQQWIGLPKRRS